MLILFSLIAGAILLAALGESPFVGAALGLLLSWVYTLSERIRHLEQQRWRDTRVAPPTPVQQVSRPAMPVSQPQRMPVETAVQRPPPLPNKPVVQTTATPPVYRPAPTYTPPQGNALDKAFASGWEWLIGGNPFVRVGIILLFLGVVFLLRYSLDQGLLPVELRLTGAAGGAIALLAYGWKLRARQGAYGLILQAGGVGLLYLTVYAAFGLYHLIPSLLTFTLLVVIAAGAATLAVMQNSLPLAAFATAGGFLAPLLASSGNNNYIGLFSFYAILNAGIVGIAWFKSWRVLNLLGFVFTFVIASLWGWNSYQPENFTTTEPFLILFFLFYVAIAVLFATRTPVNFKDKVDGTLVFGTPILGFIMQVALVQNFEYGNAISALVVGVFYLLVAAGVWQGLGKQQPLLTQTFLALGVIFTTLAIPFAVDGVVTSTAWALEGAGILWVSTRQQQWLQRAFAVLMHYAALASLMVGMVSEPLPVEAQAFSNGHFLAMLLVTVAMLVSSRLLSMNYAGKRGFEPSAAMALLFTGLLFLSLMFEQQIADFALQAHFTALHLGYALIAAGVLLVMGQFACWQLLRYALLLPLGLMGMAALNVIGLDHSLLNDNGNWWWPAAFIGLYGVLYLYQRREWFAQWLEFMQVALLWLLVLLLSHEVHIQMQPHFLSMNAWYVASLPLVAIAALWLMMRGNLWPMWDYQAVLLRYVGLPLTGLLGLWVLFSLHASGDSTPLPWLPVLNPLDVVTLLLGFTLFTLYRERLDGWEEILLHAGAALAFVWLNMLVLRAQHHWNGLPWEFPDLLLEPGTQTLLAILWTLTGMILAWRGNRIANRKLWIAGASLLGMVVLKLFVVDFASSGTLARVVSFISVGVLLLFIGYLAPLPPPEDDPQGHS
ncbi:MAG: DUF2339 domain-containing protein [Thiothrix sp.]|uniref:DUF2339 domain-containing protein n=1 Tax=Thiothrix sp. TaxID=1032 RepID=UPI0026116EAA|nr:DUF2339 domain-containing protein [Thiothrix sp.]MDD5392505.1 DUF2339 domain-containing protein [Thiothrix sp.]